MSSVVQFICDGDVIKQSKYNYTGEKHKTYGCSIFFNTNIHLVQYVKLEVLRKSSSFRKGLTENVFRYIEGETSLLHWSFAPKLVKNWKAERLDIIFQSSLDFKIEIKKELCSWRMYHGVLSERIQLEYLMACLSTLGGAHSSLGEFSQKHSIKAGEISLKQFRIACRLSDPSIIARCKIYLSHSLMQRGYLKSAAKIIREEYFKAKDSKSYDASLVLKCCIAAWNKLKYLKAQSIKEKHS